MGTTSTKIKYELISVKVFGQELNPETYAIAKADMLINSNLNHPDESYGEDENYEEREE